MAQTIFEIFTCHDGKTQGYRHGEAVAKRTCERLDGHAPMHDYLPASQEGFWIVDMRGFVKGKPFKDAREAEREANVLNMGSDSNAYSVVEHRL